jgi:cell division septum initiation protein DivIVA
MEQLQKENEELKNKIQELEEKLKNIYKICSFV